MKTGSARRGFAVALLCGCWMLQPESLTAEEQQNRLRIVQPTQQPIVPSHAPQAAGPQPQSEIRQTGGPLNSTLEIRVARRPWLLEKLRGPSKPKPSIKMNPPRPPRPIDPPSLSELERIYLMQQGASQTPAELPTDPPTEASEVPQRIPADVRSQPNKLRSDSLADEFKRAAESDALSLQDEDETQRQRPRDVSDEPMTVSPSPTIRDSASERSSAAAEPTSQPRIRVNRYGDEPNSDSVGDLMQRMEDLEASQRAPRSTRPIPLAVEIEPEITDEEAAIEEAESYRRQTNRRQVVFGFDRVEPTEAIDYAGYPLQELKLKRSVARLRRNLQNCLKYYYNRPENANGRSNWGMMHAIMVYGVDTPLLAGRERYSAIAWIAGNNACRGQRLLTQEDGQIVARSGIGLQGHQAQFLAIMGLAGVPINYALYADGEEYQLRDLIESEMLACRRGEELTFTLIGLSQYLDTNAVWRNAEDELWSFETLIREELSQPIVGSACGGTHRLMGFAHALRARRAEGRPIDGQWLRAEEFIQDFVAYTYRLQNRDGSMSTDWFEGREDNEDLERKIQTTGHMVEWLLTVTPDAKLQDPRLVRAIRFLLSSMMNEREHEWKIGPKGHALRSLAMYYERVFRSGPGWRKPVMAGRTKSASRR